MTIPQFILVKASFFLKGIQRSVNHKKKPNKNKAKHILMKPTKNLVIIASSFGTRHKLKKRVNFRIDITPSPLFAYVCILLDPPPP